MQRVGKKFRLHEVLQRNAQNDKLETYKTSLLKTLDKAGMKNRLVSMILQKNNQEKERYIEVAERIAREKDYGLVIGYEKEW